MNDLTVGKIGAEEILKVDSRGRVRVKPERREMLLDEFERSAMSMREFAAYIGVHPQTFWGWLSRRGKASGKVRQKAPKWIEAVAGPAVKTSHDAGLRIQLPGGGVMHVESEVQTQIAAALLRALEKGAAGC